MNVYMYNTLKKIYNLRSNTTNVMVYSISKRVPLQYVRYLRIIKFWLRLNRVDNKQLAAQVYRYLRYEGVQNKWVKGVENLLANVGLHDVWYQF